MLGIHLLLGTISVNLLLKFRRLSFLINTLHLPPTASALRILKSRLYQSGFLLWLTTVSDDLKLLSLPSIEDLVITPPSKASWRSHVKLSMYSYFYNTSFNTDLVPFRLTDAIHLTPQNPCDFAHPSIILSYFYNQHQFSFLLCNHIRLLLRCSDLQEHSYMFNNSTHDPTCKLCNLKEESTYHYYAFVISLLDRGGSQ